jgi:hypothetical protein
MTTRTISNTQWCAGFALLAALVASPAVFAQAHGHGGGFAEHEGPAPAGHVAAPHQHMDTRFSHNHPYYDRGYTVHDAPRTGYPIDYHHGHYRYDGGEWYLGGDLGWVVVEAPVGAFVSVLPPYYTTITYDGVPYYYANDAYYVWDEDQQEFEVVNPPPDIESADQP